MKRALNSFTDIELALRPYVNQVKKLTGTDTMLDRIVPLMEFLGHPEDKIKTIHLAGTSGKTSTAYYIASLLELAGRKVGLSVSPHIDKISERTQINGQPLEEKLFAEQLAVFLDLMDQSNIKPSYFEIIYAFSIWLFAKKKVDYAVIETGVGGLYDATNIVSREDKVAVITDIGFDHMSILGNSIKEITAQKVGIVHRHNPLLMYTQSGEIMSVIKPWVSEHQSKLYPTKQSKEEKLYGRGATFKKLPDFQKRNWLLAYFAYRFIAKRDKLKELSRSDLTKSQQIVIPARMDTTKVGDHILIMDGAHNEQKISAFISSFKHLYPNERPAVLLSFKSDKAYLKTLPKIKELASEIIVSSFDTSQDLPVVSAPPENIAASLKEIGAENIFIEPDNLKAYQILLSSKSKYLIITGSFYLISQIRQSIKHD